MFFFEPLHRRIQAFVDRSFYRQQYDYRTAIKGLSEAMTSILDPQLILRTLAGTVVREMVLENGVLLLPGPAGQGHHVAVVEGIDPATLRVRSLPENDPLLGLVKANRSHVLRHDIAMNPAYDGERAALQQTLGRAVAPTSCCR